MPSHHDPFTTDLRVGQWFTIEDEFDSRPGFLRDHDESYFRAHRPDSCPPPGVPMRVVAKHEHYIYASAMSWNGQEWCPAIVDLRRHDVVPLPGSIPAAIHAHIARERRKNQPPMPRPRNAESGEVAQTASTAAERRSSASPNAVAEGATHPTDTRPHTPAPTSTTPEPRWTHNDDETGWIRLSIHPRRIISDLKAAAGWLNPLRQIRRETAGETETSSEPVIEARTTRLQAHDPDQHSPTPADHTTKGSE
jgi:hypothetical protein